jgi:glycerophosphoryl diester phosphodiesterase
MTDMKRYKASRADDFPSEPGSDSHLKGSMRAENRWLLETYICHRGCHNGNSTCPENSLMAFETAVRKGLAMELDVQLLADGEIVVFHDSNTLRMTGVDTLITNCEAHQLSDMRLMGSDQTIPLLDDVLDLVRGEVPLLIEMKGFGGMGSFGKRILQKLEGYDGPFALQSFNPKALLWLKMRAPYILRGQISGSLKNVKLAWHRKLLVRYLLTNGITKPHFISYEAERIPEMKRLQSLRARMPIIAWTISTREQYRRLNQFCDNIIFEGFDPSEEIMQETGDA